MSEVVIEPKHATFCNICCVEIEIHNDYMMFMKILAIYFSIRILIIHFSLHQ